MISTFFVFALSLAGPGLEYAPRERQSSRKSLPFQSSIETIVNCQGRRSSSMHSEACDYRNDDQRR